MSYPVARPGNPEVVHQFFKYYMRFWWDIRLFGDGRE